MKIVKNLGLNTRLVERRTRENSETTVVHLWEKMDAQAKRDLHSYATGEPFRPKYFE